MGSIQYKRYENYYHSSDVRHLSPIFEINVFSIPGVAISVIIEVLEYFKEQFTWKEEDPRRQNNFLLSLHAEISVEVVTKWRRKREKLSAFSS